MIARVTTKHKQTLFFDLTLTGIKLILRIDNLTNIHFNKSINKL